MLYYINFQESFYPAIMLILAGVSFAFNIYLAKRSNERFKRKEMDKKLNKEDFEKYQSDHKDVHERDRKDVLYIRSRVDAIANHLLNDNGKSK